MTLPLSFSPIFKFVEFTLFTTKRQRRAYVRLYIQAPGFLLFKTLIYKYIVIAATGTWTKSSIANDSPLIFNPPQF